MRRYIYHFFLLFFLLIISCKTKDSASNFNYLQNADAIATEVSVNSSLSTIQKGDQLFILVTAKNMEVVKPFNQNYYSSQNSITPGANTNTNTVEKTYLVNSEGNIDFPTIGYISTSNKTIEDLKNELTTQVSKYVKDPTVTVRLANFKVTVLGEVARPNQYTLTDVNPTLLNALGVAGDLTMYGKRDDILVVRNIDGQISKERINLKDASFINSPFYYMKQGDVIYVSATDTKEKTARLNPNTNIYIAVAGTIIGLAGIFITIFKK